jgi:hypothetical protein
VLLLGTKGEKDMWVFTIHESVGNRREEKSVEEGEKKIYAQQETRSGHTQPLTQLKVGYYARDRYNRWNGMTSTLHALGSASAVREPWTEVGIVLVIKLVPFLRLCLLAGGKCRQCTEDGLDLA